MAGYNDRRLDVGLICAPFLPLENWFSTNVSPDWTTYKFVKMKTSGFEITYVDKSNYEFLISSLPEKVVWLPHVKHGVLDRIKSYLSKLAI